MTRDELEFCASLELFGDFASEFRDPETNSFYTSSLGDMSRHKGQWIFRTLNRLAMTVRRLLDLGWSCHWCGLDFYLTCLHSPDEAIGELQDAGGDSAEWFDVGVPIDSTDPSQFVPVGYTWGPRWALDAPDPHEPAIPTYRPRSRLQVNVLHHFEMEMELCGVAQDKVPYAGPSPPLVCWPELGFDLSTQIAGLGEAIRDRLGSLANLFDHVSQETDPWFWQPHPLSVVYWIPLSSREARERLELWQAPMDRVSVEPIRS